MKKRFKAAKLAAAFLFSAAAAVAAFFSFPRGIEYTAQDAVYHGALNIPSNICIIAIDEATLSELGAYSEWDRSVFARLLDTINVSESERPEVIGIDVIFSGHGNESSDLALAQAAGRYSNVIVASKLELSTGADAERYISDEIAAYEELNKVTRRGFTVPLFDSDGFIRRSYGRITSGGRDYTSFALKIAEAMGYDGEIREIYEFSYSGGAGDFEAVPMSSVLNGTVPASYFNGRTVLIGSYEEGMMDSYSVPVDRSRKMYGVEVQANIIAALMNGKLTYTLPPALRLLAAFVITALAGLLISKRGPVSGAVSAVGAAAAYPALCALLFKLTAVKTSVFCVPAAILLMYFAILLIHYAEIQYRRSDDMREMLFSMANSMSETIEVRTPYNANHTKNVAKMCGEMLDRINYLHSKGQTRLRFSENDKNQLYLAAMLHDIGKMDIPVNVMNKPTKLGKGKGEIRNRLKMIQLYLRVDGLRGKIAPEEAEREEKYIDSFIERIEYFDCGKTLSDEELEFIDEFGKRSYESEDGAIPYLTPEELDCLHIRTGTLSDSEREIMKKHVVYTDRILSHVTFGKEFDKVRRIAADHHEFLNGKGYPNGKSADELDALTRILTLIDIYDSLIADDRPYKKPKTVPEAFEILDEEAAEGRIDKELLEIARSLYLDR